MSTADAAVVRRDPALPDLALLLDPDRLQDAMERTLGRRLARPVITYLRYKRGQSCLAACRLDLAGETIDFAAKHHRADADKLQTVMTRPSVTGPLGAGRFVLRDTTVVVSVFPNDGKLKKLGWLDSAEAVADLAGRIEGGHRWGPAAIHTLHFNPERRFVGRLTVGGRSRATVRCYRRQDYSDALAKADLLQSMGPLTLARLLLHEDHNSVVVLDWLEGRSLEESIAQKRVAAEELRLVGAALATLHGQQAPALPQRTAASDAAAVVSLAHGLSEICPELDADARRLAAQLAERLTADGHIVCPIHGDFYARQVVVDGGAAGVLDLDGAALGHPAIDLGRFCADLEAAVIRGRLDLDTVDAVIESLLEGYQLTRGVRPTDLDLYSAAHLFYLTTHPFRRREGPWRERSAQLLERARMRLELHDRATASRTVVPRRLSDAPAAPAFVRPCLIDPFGAASDPTMPFLARALDPAAMAEQFATLGVCEAMAVPPVRQIAVTRHKPGRRCLIAYEIAMPRGPVTVLIGKVRARGPDTGTHQLVERLWAGAFGPGATDGISVPEPVGVITALHMTVQRKVAGSPFEGLLDGPRGRQLAHRAAEAIDKLHGLALPAVRRHSVDDEIRILEERLAGVAQEFPAWRDRLSALLEECRRLANRVRSDRTCGIHRDFYPNQLLVDGERVYLLDLDLYSEGHPALDIGNFLAHVDEYSLRRFGDPDRLADRKQALVDRYLELSQRTTREAIEIYAALSLVRHVALSRQFPDRRPHTGALVDLCERRLIRREPSRTAPRHDLAAARRADAVRS